MQIIKAITHIRILEANAGKLETLDALSQVYMPVDWSWFSDMLPLFVAVRRPFQLWAMLNRISLVLSSLKVNYAEK
ncbi:MAG: hypothetical protein WCS37_14310 [Chloroflexota bacterium]|nr:hypothetical protein [Chloroflexota bacterium]